MIHLGGETNGGRLERIVGWKLESQVEDAALDLVSNLLVR